MTEPTSEAQLEKAAAAFAKFMEGQIALVVDPGVTSRASIARALVGMGIKTQQLVLVNSYAQAESMIEKHSPRLIIADYDLGKRCGLDLLLRQRQKNPKKGPSETFFILVTGNTSQSAVARAAEEDVDTFIIKPFNAAILRSLILKAAMSKIQPPKYYQVIERGKESLENKKLDEAFKLFEEATHLDSAPALGLFYMGKAEQEKASLEKAEADFLKGLQFNKIHYKCLVGLFDNLMTRKKFVEAYSVIKKISQYFPANPQRMTQVLRLAIMTKSYEDVERYFQIFTTIDERNEEMIKYVCAALVVCGKYYLQQNHMARARELFQKAGTTANGRTRILREIITALVDAGLAKNASEFLQKFPPNTHSGVDYLAMKLLVNDEIGGAALTLKDGTQLLQKDFHDPIIYKVLIRRVAILGNKELATDLVHRGSRKYPEHAQLFQEVLKTNLREKKADTTSSSKS